MTKSEAKIITTILYQVIRRLDSNDTALELFKLVKQKPELFQTEFVTVELGKLVYEKVAAYGRGVSR